MACNPVFSSVGVIESQSSRYLSRVASAAQGRLHTPSNVEALNRARVAGQSWFWRDQTLSYSVQCKSELKVDEVKSSQCCPLGPA